NIIRCKKQDNEVSLGVIDQKKEVKDITAIDNSLRDIITLYNKAKRNNMSTSDFVSDLLKKEKIITFKTEDIKLLTPLSATEIWAGGVTYQGSRNARNNETSHKEVAETFYDKVYSAKRPELFLKSTEKRTTAPGDYLHIRSDSNWQVPEPEL